MSDRIIFSEKKNSNSTIGGTLLYLDVSGSMRFCNYYDPYQQRDIPGTGVDWIIPNLGRLQRAHPNINIQFYGSDREVKTRNLGRLDIGSIRFGGFTSTLNLITPCKYLKIAPETIIFIGDGAFSDKMFISRLQILEQKGFLQNLKNFFVFFTPNTSLDVKEKLSLELLNFCTIQENIAVSPIFIQCRANQVNLLTDIEENLNRNSLDIPKGWFNVFNLVGFSPDISIFDVSYKLMNRDKDLRHIIFQKMKTIIESDPEKLLTNKIYTKIHLLLHSLFREEGEYREYFQKLNRNATPFNRRIYQELIESSYKDEDEWARLYKNIEPYVGDQFVSVDIPEDIYDSIKNKTLLNHIPDILSSVRTNEEEGFAILSQEAPQKVLETHYRLFFKPYRISVQLSLALIMSIMTTSVEVPKSFLDMTTKTALGMKNSIKKFFLCDEPDEIYYSVRFSTIIGKFFKLYHKQLFTDTPLKESQKEKLRQWLTISQVYQTIGAVNFLKNQNFKIYRTIPQNGYVLPEKNTLFLLPPFEKDPQPKLPSLARVKKVYIEKGAIYMDVEYLDRPFGSGDIHIYKFKYLNELEDFEFLGNNLDDNSLQILNRFVIKLAARPELQGRDMDEEIHRRALNEFKELLDDVKTKDITVEIPVPDRLLIKLFVKNPLIRKLVLRGQNPNMRDIIQASNMDEEDDEDDKKYQIVYDHYLYHITDAEVKNLDERFFEYINQSQEPELRVLEEDYCPICLDCCAVKDMIKESCGHPLCEDCSAAIKPDYTDGAVVENQHTCPQCRALIRFENSEVTEWFNGDMKQLPRFCLTCSKFFLQDPPACGGGEEALQKYCKDCTVSQYRECPSCGVMVEHIGACDKMHCTNCDASFCFVCGFLPTSTGYEQEDEVYRHLHDIHGGIYNIQNNIHRENNADYDEYDDDDDSDYEY